MQSIFECFYIANAGVIVRPETANNARRTSSAAPDLHLSTATTPPLANALAAADPLVKQPIAVFETKLNRLRDARAEKKAPVRTLIRALHGAEDCHNTRHDKCEVYRVEAQGLATICQEEMLEGADCTTS